MKNRNNSTTTNSNVSKILRRIIIIIPIGIFINLALTIFTKDRTTLDSLINFSPIYFSLAILLIIIPWFANVLRLKIWTEFFHRKLSFIQTLKVVMYSELSAAISPTALGGAPLKIGLLMQRKVPSGPAFTIASIGTLEDLAFLMIAVPSAIIWTTAWKLPIFMNTYYKIKGIIFWLGLTGLVLSLILYLLFLTLKKMNPDWLTRHLPAGKISLFAKLKQRLANLWRDFKEAYGVIIKRGKSRFFFTTLLTGVQWICRYSVVTALVASLGLPVNPVLFFVLQWLVFSMAVFIPTPGATGGAEASFYFIFLSVLPGESMGVITAGWRFIAFYSYLAVGGLLFITSHLFLKLHKKACDEAGKFVLADSA